MSARARLVGRRFGTFSFWPIASPAVRGRARWFTVAAAVGVFCCALLPWGTSGRVSRTSFALLRSAERLDLVHGFWLRVLLVGWYLMPLAVGVAWLFALARRPLAVALLGAVVGVMGIALALIVRASPLHPEIGTSATIVAGALTIAGAAATAWTYKENR